MMFFLYFQEETPENVDFVIRQAEGDNYFPNLCEFKRNKEYSHTFDLSDENRLGVIIYTSGTTGANCHA